MTILQLLTPIADVSWPSVTDTVREAFVGIIDRRRLLDLHLPSAA